MSYLIRWVLIKSNGKNMNNKTELSAWDRLRKQFKPDGKGRFKTVDAMKIAVQIDNERLALKQQLENLKNLNK